MRAFAMVCTSDAEGDYDFCPYKYLGKSACAERTAFSLLSSVCWDWHQALAGWKESPTRHWVRRQLKKRIERKSTASHDTRTRNVCTKTRLFFFLKLALFI